MDLHLEEGDSPIVGAQNRYAGFVASRLAIYRPFVLATGPRPHYPLAQPAQDVLPVNALAVL